MHKQQKTVSPVVSPVVSNFSKAALIQGFRRVPTLAEHEHLKPVKQSTLKGALNKGTSLICLTAAQVSRFVAAQRTPEAVLGLYSPAFDEGSPRMLDTCVNAALKKEADISPDNRHSYREAAETQSQVAVANINRMRELAGLDTDTTILTTCWDKPKSVEMQKHSKNAISAATTAGAHYKVCFGEDAWMASQLDLVNHNFEKSSRWYANLALPERRERAAAFKLLATDAVRLMAQINRPRNAGFSKDQVEKSTSIACTLILSLAVVAFESVLIHSKDVAADHKDKIESERDGKAKTDLEVRLKSERQGNGKLFQQTTDELLKHFGKHAVTLLRNAVTGSLMLPLQKDFTERWTVAVQSAP